MALKAAKMNDYGVVRWTLVSPLDLSAPETQWWDTWREEQESTYDLTIELWDKHRLDTLLRPPDAHAIRDVRWRQAR